MSQQQIFTPATGTAEFGILMAAVWLVCGLSAVSSAVPAVEHAVDLALAGLAAVGLAWLMAAAVRRERRIGRRLAAIQPVSRPEPATTRSLPGIAVTTAPRAGVAR